MAVSGANLKCATRRSGVRWCTFPQGLDGGWIENPVYTSYTLATGLKPFLVILGSMRNLFTRIPLSLLVVVCLTLGLAPFTPEPHLLEKLKMLIAGELVRPIDIFDLVLHGAPWVLLVLKLYLLSTRKKVDNGE